MKRLLWSRMAIGLGTALRLGAVTLCVAGALDARAVGLSLAPSSLSPAVGSSFAVDLVVSGLGAGSAPSLGAFDIAIAYDPGAITFSGASFGTLLGGLPGEATADILPAAGSVELAEVSLLAPPALDGLQPSSFTLATLSFVATTAGVSTLSIDSAVLGDAFGASLALTTSTGAVVTSEAPSAVPEPEAFLLYAAGLLVAARAGRRSSARPKSST